MRTIYRLANISTAVPRLAMNLLQMLFVNLKGDALAFLAGIWVSCVLETGDANLVPSVALHHALAFLEAHIAEDDGMDFQTIFPAFLVALQSQDVDVRQAALTCILCLRRLADRRFTTVYRFDTIYGRSESEYDLRLPVVLRLIMNGVLADQLQYLDQEDFKRYLDALREQADHLALDVEHVKLFHQQHLGPDNADKKRDGEYVSRSIPYLDSLSDILVGTNIASCATCSPTSTPLVFRVLRLSFSRLSKPYQIVRRLRCCFLR